MGLPASLTVNKKSQVFALNMDVRVRTVDPGALKCSLVNVLRQRPVKSVGFATAWSQPVHRRVWRSAAEGGGSSQQNGYGAQNMQRSRHNDAFLRQRRTAPVGTTAVGSQGFTPKQQPQSGDEAAGNVVNTPATPRTVAGRVGSPVGGPKGFGSPQAAAARNSSPAGPVPGPKSAPPRPTVSRTLKETIVRPGVANTSIPENTRLSEPAPPATRPQAAPAPGLPPLPQQVKPVVDVQFWLGYHTEFGQSIRVVGSDPALGEWRLEKAAQMSWSEGDMWKASVKLQGGQVYEYKYALVNSQGQPVNWQKGNNSVLALKVDDSDINVYDNWEGSPGAKVMVGGTALSREKRLLTWAQEIEALVHEQRGQMRLSKIELQSAQEEARKEREVAQIARAELTRAETDLRNTRKRVSELETVNRLLRTQLKETQETFRHALQTAQKYIIEAEEGRKLGADGGLELFVNAGPTLHAKEDGAKAGATAGVPNGNGKVPQ
eukprot:jgi/Botrbrau1/19791/Bobra.0124s0039.1